MKPEPEYPAEFSKQASVKKENEGGDEIAIITEDQYLNSKPASKIRPPSTHIIQSFASPGGRTIVEQRSNEEESPNNARFKSKAWDTFAKWQAGPIARSSRQAASQPVLFPFNLVHSGPKLIQKQPRPQNPNRSPVLVIAP